MKNNLWQQAEQLIEQPLDSSLVFKGKLLHIYQDTVELPNEKLTGREWIKHPGACAIVPVFRDGTIMLVKQYRYSVRQVFYEVPAGKIDPGESVDGTAFRETREETGLAATSMAYIGHIYPVIGYSDEIIHLYAAWDLTQNESNSEEDEFLIKLRIPFSEALHMIECGEITDAKTICSLLKAEMWWKKNRPFEVSFR